MKPSRLLPIALLWAVSLSLVACNRAEPPPDDPGPIAEATPRADYPIDAPSTRLPASVSPRAYDLKLKIDPRSTRFEGTARIEVDIAQPLNYFWIHGKTLTVTGAQAELADGRRIDLTWEQVLPTGTAKVSASEPLPATQATLTFHYNAPFNTSLEGLYKVQQGEDSYAFTQFQSTSARLAFPAFDEPAFKAPFDIQLTVPSVFTAVSSAPESATVENGDGSKTITFASTPPLPTYLVAFAVGPFDVVEWQPIPAGEYRSAPVPLRGITTRGKGDQIRYALENTADIFLAMEQYFDIAYPFAKLDLIAVPDFAAGAMENVGAITYREQLLLLDKDASVSQKRGFFITHAHELSHQWFGNLVTPEWWDDIWLNEAFATWNAYVILDQLYPDEGYREALSNGSSYVMNSDSLASARPIREPIERHQDIGSAFNDITYLKGGGVLDMFEAFLSADRFREGIRRYMKQFAFGNTTAGDFIGAIAEANPQVDSAKLKAAFSSFISQPGLPMLQADLNCGSDGPRLDISQQRYLPAGSTGDTAQTWVVPACVDTLQDGSSGTQCFLLDEQTQSLPLTSVEGCPDALLPNAGGAGYYRWSLPPGQWAALMERFDSLNSREQISVANSLSAALNSGELALPAYLDAVGPITHADSWRVALAPRGDLYKLKEHVLSGADREALMARMRQWYRPVLEDLDALDEPAPDQKQFRMLVLSTLGLGAEDPEIHRQLARQGEMLTGFGSDRELKLDALDPNLRYISLIAGVEAHGRPFAELLWEHFLRSDDALFRGFLLGAMARSTEPEFAALMRARILAPELRDNEIYDIFGAQMAEEANRDALLEWTRNNLDAVLARIATWRQGQLPEQFEDFCSEADATRVKAMFEPIIDELESGPRYLANALETIRLCAAFARLHRPEDNKT